MFIKRKRKEEKIHCETPKALTCLSLVISVINRAQGADTRAQYDDGRR